MQHLSQNVAAAYHVVLHFSSTFRCPSQVVCIHRGSTENSLRCYIGGTGFRPEYTATTAMAAASVTLFSPNSFASSYSFLSLRKRLSSKSINLPNKIQQSSYYSFCSRPNSKFVLKSADDDTSSSATTTAIVEDEKKSTDSEGKSETQNEEEKQKQEEDWKGDEDFKKFMGNPSIEAALKLEKKRTERRLKELETEAGGNIFQSLLAKFQRNFLAKEKERLEQVEEKFKALDLNKLKSCFGYDTFFAVDVRRFGDGGIFVGNLRRPIEEVIPKLEKKLADAAGREVALWFMEERVGDITKQVCMVQPKAEIDLQLEISKLSNPFGYVTAILLGITTLGTIAITSGFFLKPDATFEDYVNDVIPLFGGFLTILGVSEIATRLTAARYGVKLSPSFLIPSNWTGCLGVVNNYESILPNQKALFDIPAARTASAYVASIALAATAFFLDGSFNGGDNALYIRPQFFFNNPFLSFIQYFIGPYADELGNVLPQAVEGVGVPVDPLAFAGLLGIAVTSLNLLPCGRLEGGRIAQALFGRRAATLLSFATSVLLGVGALSGSVLCLAWGLLATFLRGGEELPAKDEITPLGDGRYIFGFVLALVCFLTLFPNTAGTYTSPFYTLPYFRGD